MKTYFDNRNKFICPSCGYFIKYNSFWAWVSRPHMFDEWRFIKCPKCKKRSWMRRIK